MKAVGKGFTLVELVIVVLLIGALTFITVPKLAMSVVNLGKSQTGAQRMASAIRHCRTLAISNASEEPQGFRLSMTGPPSGYTGFQIIKVRTGAVVKSETIPSNVACTGANDFVFGPLGNRTGDTDSLSVSGGGKTYVISVITSTGMVKCDLQ